MWDVMTAENERYSVLLWSWRPQSVPPRRFVLGSRMLLLNGSLVKWLMWRQSSFSGKLCSCAFCNDNNNSTKHAKTSFFNRIFREIWYSKLVSNTRPTKVFHSMYLINGPLHLLA